MLLRLDTPARNGIFRLQRIQAARQRLADGRYDTDWVLDNVIESILDDLGSR